MGSYGELMMYISASSSFDRWIGLTMLLLGLLTDNALLLKSCVAVAGCPTGIVVPILTLRSGRDAALASNSVIVTTLLSLITLPVLLMVLG